MELYFTESENIGGDEAFFDAFEARHILKTMRRKAGDQIQFTNGKGSLFQGTIIATHPVLRVKCKNLEQHSWPIEVHSILGIGFIRPARLDYLIEKTTELGITRFYLFSSHYSNYRTDNTGRWVKIARQAMKQSNRLYLPEIRIMPDLKHILSESAEIKNKYIAEQSSSTNFVDLLKKNKVTPQGDILFLIGPEGGFDNKEIQTCNQNGFLSLNFGEYRLRTETAAITAASYMNLIRN